MAVDKIARPLGFEPAPPVAERDAHMVLASLDRISTQLEKVIFLLAALSDVDPEDLDDEG